MDGSIFIIIMLALFLMQKLSKFILPKEGKEWVMTGVQEAWKGYKTRIKGKHFEIYNNIEVILKNRPLDIPEVQFRKLITYWSIPSVKALSRLNSENRKKQQHQHRMGPKSFARTQTISSIKTELHETKDRVQSLEDLVKLLLQQSSLGTNIDEAVSLLRAKESTHDINSKQCPNGNDRPSSSTRDPK
ncbi:hypothetical protein AHAS_Ahas02G0144500 [Arachis hypogaea]